ncbi:MAG: hypothetical protein HY447_02490 [Candidatus Omnitrophica bacterium]|nr:hypothetical protein [Candidatus Omnitrophota bacterium]
MSESLVVGIPREIKPREKRVGLTPRGVKRLIDSKIHVLVEKGAGQASGFSDEKYKELGAEIIVDASELYQRANLIKKVKEPYSSELAYLSPHHVLFAFLHLASPENANLIKTLIDRKVTAIGLETMEKEGRTICLEPMSEIAGTLAAYFAGFFRKSVSIQKGSVVYSKEFFKELEELAMKYPDFPKNLPPGKTIVFGGGAVGRNAATTLLEMGGEVDLVEKKREKRETLQKEFHSYGSRFRVWGLEDNFQASLKEADSWIGCVHVAGERAPLVLSHRDLQRLTSGKPKIILDIAVDQGGNFPGTHSTTYDNPLYLDDFGNLRFGVTNTPSLCGKGASEAIERVTLPYTLLLAQNGEEAIQKSSELRTGLQVFRGKLVNEAVARAHHLPLSV